MGGAGGSGGARFAAKLLGAGAAGQRTSQTAFKKRGWSVTYCGAVS